MIQRKGWERELRRIPVVMATPDMILAKDVWGRDSILLTKGTDNIMCYRDKLILNGIASIYVEDEVSDDIYDEAVVCDNTREHCTQILSDTIENAKVSGAVDMKGIDYIVSSIIREMLSNPDMILGLTDIYTSNDITLQHSIDSTIYALFLGKLCNFSKKDMKFMGKGMLMHDIGKIALDPDRLYKNGFLNADERKHVENHPQWGYRMLEEEGFLEPPAREIALFHHERLDGSGYPFGLKGDDIPRLSRAAAVADVYDALTSERSYKAAMTNEQAIKVLLEDAQKGKLDVAMVENFVSKLAVYPNGVVVLLNNGEPAIVKSQNRNDSHRPVVRIIDFKNQCAYAKRDCDLEKERDLYIAKSHIKISDLPENLRCQFV
jgi:HD-GYP domain-containing protein (c-di-GMP phosphodiesterase class II)